MRDAELIFPGRQIRRFKSARAVRSEHGRFCQISAANFNARARNDGSGRVFDGAGNCGSEQGRGGNETTQEKSKRSNEMGQIAVEPTSAALREARSGKDVHSVRPVQTRQHIRLKPALNGQTHVTVSTSESTAVRCADTLHTTRRTGER